ncbi:MAG: tetratricopeptide repeat protein [Desulfobulbus sp.]
MARAKRRPLGAPDQPKPPRLFADREEPQEIFVRALQGLATRASEYHILMYYGVAGIGKSRLQEHLRATHLAADNDAVYSALDFKDAAVRQPHKAYRTLADRFYQKFRVPCPLFYTAYTIYLSKAEPFLEVREHTLPFLDKGGQLSALADTAGAMGGLGDTVVAEAVGFTGNIGRVALDLLGRVYRIVQAYQWGRPIIQELQNLQSKTAAQIEAELGRYLGYDLERYREKHPKKKLVIFLDTYEALWEGDHREAVLLSQDAWVRDQLIPHCPRVLFVLCGRESLRWVDDDLSWSDDLEQYLIGDLSEPDGRSFLQSCGINDAALQDVMLSGCKGVPFFLDLCVDTFECILETGAVPDVQDFEGVGQEAIFERFHRYLSQAESATLRVLACATFFTEELFAAMVTEFATGYPAGDVPLLARFSFITEEGGRCYIHGLMRDNLRFRQSEESRRKVQLWLFAWYDQKLAGCDSKQIPDDLAVSLDEAFLYKRSVCDSLAELDSWYWQVFKKILSMGQYQVLFSSCLQMVDMLEEQAGNQDPDTATGYNNLALLYESMGEYKEALPLSEKALAIFEKALGPEHPDTATIYNNLAGLYESMGQYKKALPLYENALAICEKALGLEHPSTATSYNNLAALYYSMGEYKEALPLSEKALAIKEKTLGMEHPSTATSYNNLAALYKSMGEYEKALLLYEKALAIREKTLGLEHPDTAASYNNLALLYESMGKYEKALPFCKKALTTCEKLLGKEHPTTQTIRTNYQACLAQRDSCG